MLTCSSIKLKQQNPNKRNVTPCPCIQSCVLKEVCLCGTEASATPRRCAASASTTVSSAAASRRPRKGLCDWKLFLFSMIMFFIQIVWIYYFCSYQEFLCFQEILLWNFWLNTKRNKNYITWCNKWQDIDSRDKYSDTEPIKIKSEESIALIVVPSITV